MKTSTFAAAIVMALTALPVASAIAQGGPGGPGAGFERMSQTLQDSLRIQASLTDEQAAAVNGIFKDSAERRQEIAAKYRAQGNREGFRSMRAEMEAIRAETDEQLELVLTPGQMDQFRALRARMQERLRAQRGMRRPPG